jgi:glycyl-tRNA synthetase beta chain
MADRTLLVELNTEELPPKSLRRLGDAFAEGIRTQLAARGFLTPESVTTVFATPRRLGASITAVRPVAPDQPFIEKLMPVAVGLDKDGKATPALQKKLAAKQLSHVDVKDLLRESDGKAEQLVYKGIASGDRLQVFLEFAVADAIKALPIPKVMSYQLADGETTVQFVRPAHGLVALHGKDIVAVRVLGLEAGRVVHGHRFQGAKDISLLDAGEYEARLKSEGAVIASFDKRRDAIHLLLEEKAGELGASLGPRADVDRLLDEVAGLVEHPAIYAGQFDAAFLAVPQECLILTMRANQRYFPLFDAGGALTNRFLLVSNMRLGDASNIVRGNERVIRPRLADARFFFETDKKVRLADRVPLLAGSVYHNKLGSLLDRVERLRKLAPKIQEMLPRGAMGKSYADRAALLCKADLVTGMVGEFPELQGTMGRYYAEADGEEHSVARAIEQHYKPRFAGDTLPEGDVSLALALADKLETLAGMFGIGAQPTGDKDPFALRRHALGVVRMLVEGGLALSLDLLVRDALGVFPAGLLHDARVDLTTFLYERLRAYLKDAGYSANEIESVLSMRPDRLDQVPKQVDAVRAFALLPEAESLAAANKRVVNILRQAEAKGESFANVAPGLLAEPAEKTLFEALGKASLVATPLFASGDYTGYLKAFAVLKAPVDAFFDSVMVNAGDPAVRRNRLALLADLRREMNRVADLSKLAA